MTADITVASYYNYLKNGNWNKKRPDLPEIVDQLFCDWSSVRKFGRVFVTSSVYLNGLLKLRSIQNRASVKRQSPTLKSSDTVHTAAANKLDNTRIGIVPALILSNDSSIVQASVMLFCLTNSKDSFKRDLLFSMLESKITFTSVQHMLDEITHKSSELKSRVDSVRNELVFKSETVKTVIRNLLDTSDLLRDKSYAKLALTINVDVYTKYLLDNTSGNPNIVGRVDCLKNVAPYDPLFARYISLCVAPKDQNEMRVKLYKQFAVNRYDIIANVIKELPSETTLLRKPTNKQDSLSFDENTTYYVYESKINFMKLLSYSEMSYNNQSYMVLTYNDCVFDVIGQNLFGKTWQERLDEIPGPAKIRIEKRTGHDLNNYKANNRTLGISWLDKDGHIVFKVHTPKRSESTSTTINVSSTTSDTHTNHHHHHHHNNNSNGDQTDTEDIDTEISRKKTKLT